MKNLYTLLRNNQTSGPFKLEELKLLTLTTHDLVWLEGSSQSWRNVAEVPELKGFISGSSWSSDASCVPGNLYGEEEVELVVKYARPLADIRQDYENWKAHKSQQSWRSVFTTRAIPVTIVVAFIFTAIFLNSPQHNDKTLAPSVEKEMVAIAEKVKTAEN